MKRIFLLLIFTFIFFIYFNLLAGDRLQDQILKAKNKVLPALVHIEPVKEVFSSGIKVKVRVTGSGFIFSKDGYVLTNNHVAEKASRVKCTLANLEEVQAEVVGLDALTDVAILKLDLSQVEDTPLPFVEFGDSDSIEVGEFVLALGSPLGLSRSLSMGVISSVDRYFEDEGQMVSPFNLWIQTDAAINPGNSGGPLVNMEGKVIGINARAIMFGENLGFAIPINTAKLVIDRILKDKIVERSWIGVEWQEIREYKKYINQPKLSGVLVAHIEKNSPADIAGMLPGDLVANIDGEDVNSVYKEELPKIRKLISEIPVGSNLSIKLYRNGKEHNVFFNTEKRGKFVPNEFACKEWGLSVQEITPRIVENLKLKDDAGVLISGVLSGSFADDADIFRGDVLRYIDDEKIKDFEHFKKLYNKLKEIPSKGRMLKLSFRNSIKYALLKEK